MQNLSRVIRIDESEIRGHLDEMVRGTVDETINNLLDAEADEMCPAQRYARSPDRVDTRAGHDTRKLHTKAGGVEVKMPKLSKQHCLRRSSDFTQPYGNPRPTGLADVSGAAAACEGKPLTGR